MNVKSTRKPWIRPTLTARFLLLLFGLLALQLLQLGVGVYSMRRIEQQGALATAINETRLQTIRLSEVTRDALRPDGDRTRVDRTEADSTLVFHIISYGQGLMRIETLLEWFHGEEIALPALAAEASWSWDELLYPLLQQARRSTSPAVTQEQLARYQALSGVQIERLSRMLRIIEEREREVAHRLAWVQTTIVGLSLFLVGVGAFLMRHLVTRPLRSFIDVTRAMASGAFDRRVDVHSNDEIGDLARAFDRMAGAVEDKTDRLRAFNEVALAVTSSLSLQEILQQILIYGLPLTGARGLCIALYDESARSFSNWVTRGLSDSYVSTITFPPGGLANEVMRRGDYVVSHDRIGSEFPLPPAARDEGIHSIMCLPLASAKQRLGVIYFYRDTPEDLSFEETELMSTFSHLAAHAIRNARLHETTVDLAETDSLTGLSNRRKLDQRLQQEIARAQRTSRPLALVLLDVDLFKGINDSYGHAAGDAVLRALADIFQREVRDVDLAARVGGEEFMLLLPETDAARAQRVAERIRAALHAQPISVPGAGRLQVTVSFGIACYPQDANAAEVLMANADRALYMAKQGGRDRVALFSESVLH